MIDETLIRAALAAWHAAFCRKDADAVFVVEDGKAVLTPVQAGEVRGEQRVIASGLAPGDSVVLAPAAELQDGAEVREKTAP